MKKIFKIPDKRSSFFIHISEPLVCNDVNSYCIMFEREEDIQGAQLVVSVKRADGAVITDTVTVIGPDVSYTLKNNMYSAPGEVNVRLQVVKDGMMLTEKQLVFTAIEGYENGELADDRIPVLENLIIETQKATAKATAAAEGVPMLGDVLRYKGDINEEELPSENNVVGDIYRTQKVTGETKVYVESTYNYDNNNDIKYLSGSPVNLLTQEENDAIDWEEIWSNGGSCSIPSMDVYTADWVYVGTSTGTYADGYGGVSLTTDVEELLTVGETYYITRSDTQIPYVTTLLTHTFGNTYISYSIYNDVFFDKLYTSETVDTIFNEKIGDIEAALDGIIALQNSYTGGDEA